MANSSFFLILFLIFLCSCDDRKEGGDLGPRNFSRMNDLRSLLENLEHHEISPFLTAFENHDRNYINQILDLYGVEFVQAGKGGLESWQDAWGIEYTIHSSKDLTIIVLVSSGFNRIYDGGGGDDKIMIIDRCCAPL